jgi:hypothetical protein
MTVVHTGVAPVESVVKVIDATCGLVELAQPLNIDKIKASDARDRLHVDRRFRSTPGQNPVIKVTPGRVNRRIAGRLAE